MKLIKNLRNASKRTKIIVLASLLLTVTLCGAVAVNNYFGASQKSTHTVKVYENMAENTLAEQVREYIKASTVVDEEKADAVATMAVEDYNTILNSGVDNVTDAHTKALEESIKDVLEDTLIGMELTEEDFNYLSNGICQLIWNALLNELAESELLNEQYEKQYIELTASLQKQIDDLEERSTAISITANIKKSDEGIGAAELENAKTDIYDSVYSDLYSELDTMKKEITTDVMQNVSDGKDGKDGRDGKSGETGKKGEAGKDGISTYTHIRYAASGDGTGMTDKPQENSSYIGIYSGTEKDAPTDKSKYVWSKYQGADGAATYTYIRYSVNSDGTNMTDTPQEDSTYIGFYSGVEKEAPVEPGKYTWSAYRGKDGALSDYNVVCENNVVYFYKEVE